MYFPDLRNFTNVANPVFIVLSFGVGAILLGSGPLPVFGEALLQDVSAERLRIIYSALPRAAISLVAGAVLALSGMLYQQLLRNPLAEPATLGAAAGSHLALVFASLFVPFLLDGGRLWVAGIGAIAATAAVALIAGRAQFAPVTLIISGLLISLFCSGVTSALTVFNHEYLSDIYVWQSGNLRQMGWQNTEVLLSVLSLCWLLAWLLCRPLSVVTLGNEMVRAVGLNVSLLRAVVLLIATLLGAAAVSCVGVIAFLGFMAPALARLCGARTVRALLLWAPLHGASLLFLADAVIQSLPFTGEMPTGTALAITGAPFLMFLVWRRSTVPGRPSMLSGPARKGAGWQLLAASFIVTLLVFLAVTLVGRSSEGWHLLNGVMDPYVTWQIRVPHSVVALAAGSVLAISGVLLQRATGNDMASPEVLGISSAAALGVVCVLFLFPNLPVSITMYGAAVGAFTAGSTIMAMCLYGVDPLRLMLSGMTLTIIFSGLIALFLASGDPRMSVIISWLSGSTYNATAGTAIAGLAAALVLLILAVGMTRILTVLPLGDAVAIAVGMSVRRSRLLVFLIAIIGTVCGTILIGPLTFVGHIAPHLARQLGCNRPRQELLVAPLLGGAMLMLADWIGRNIIYPWQLSAGIVAAVISGPFVILLLRKTKQ